MPTHCSGNMKRRPTIFGVSEEYLLNASQHFSGVLVDQGQACKSRAAALASPTAMFALLYLCGNYHVNLVAPVLQNILLPYNSYSASSGVISNASALLAFGGRVSATITAGRVANNTGISALLLMDAAVVRVADTAFSGNQGHQGTAGLVLHQARLTVAGSHASSNVATEGGGVLFAQDNARIAVANSTFVSNSVPNLLKGGGVVMAYNSANISIIDCTLTGNHANFGGVALMKGSSILNIDGSVWKHNSAGDAGGCINAVDTSVVQIIQSKFIQNNAKWGGIIETDNMGACNISGSGFSDNAAQSAGVVYGNDVSTIFIDGSSFDFNTAFEAGGAIYADDDCKVNVQHSNFSNNVVTGAVKVQGGGALHAATAARVNISNSFFSNNRAVLGGGVFAYVNSSMLISDSEFVNNSAESGGGVLVAGIAGVHISNSGFSFNDATGQSRSNVAFVGGGGAAAANAATLTITDSAFSSNAATLGAGVVAVNAAILTINGSSVFMHNNASQDGGGVCVLGDAVLQLSPSTQIVNNVAGGRGGGVSLGNGNFAVGDVLAAAGHNNTAKLGDSRVAVTVRRLALVSSPFVHGYVSRGATSDSGNDSSLQAQLFVSGHYDLPCEGVSVRAMLEGTAFLGVNSSGSRGSVSLHLKVTRPPGVYSIVFSLTDDPAGIAPATLQLERGPPALAEPSSWRNLGTGTQHQDHPRCTACSAHATGSSYSSKQCSHGYQGNLCGVCADGFGSLKPFTCTACSKPSVTIGLYAAAAVVLLAYMMLLCHLNMTGSESAAGQAGTYMLVIVGINIQLPEPLALPSTALSWLWAAAAAPVSPGIECAFPDSDIPLPLRNSLFYLCMPLAMLAALLCIQGVIMMGVSRPPCCYWECVMVFETVVLVAIRVFGWTLGPFYQGLAVNVVVALILIVLLVVRPYAHQQSGRVALHGMGCLLLTSYAVLSFVRCGGAAAGREYVLALGVATVMINLVFVCSVRSSMGDNKETVAQEVGTQTQLELAASHAAKQHVWRGSHNVPRILVTRSSTLTLGQQLPCGPHAKLACLPRERVALVTVKAELQQINFNAAGLASTVPRPLPAFLARAALVATLADNMQSLCGVHQPLQKIVTVELKRLMKGQAGTEEQEAAEHDAAVRGAAQGDSDYADSLHRPTRTEAPDDQLASTGRISADDVRREFPSTDHSAQGVTTAAVSDGKA
ncbi:hypothetical protein COO60DRAFT_1623865 [Scenedesmus sp. NREL 46B-D3]|nr:hypothetical protein COO60DRAFT_1623865 [Scenedesmus sp. NREL 46B-D3]